MIIISETPKLDVLVAIDREMATVTGLRDTLDLLQDSGKETLDLANAVIAKNAVLKGIENGLKRGLSPSVTLLSNIEDVLTHLGMWLPKLRERIIKSKTAVYDKDTITFKEKGILDTVSAVNFYNRYATQILDIILTQANKDEPLQSLLTKVDLAFFNDTAPYFINLSIRFSDSVKSLETMIDDLSDELYDETSEEIIAAQLGDAGVQVLRNAALHKVNPLHWWKMRKMKKDINTIQSNIESINMLAMKIARLNNRNQGTQNPDLDRQIEVYQDGIIKKRAQNLSIEAKYNGNRV